VAPGATGSAPGPFVPTADLDLIRSAAIFREPAYIPQGYIFESAIGNLRDNQLTSYELTYRGPRGFVIVIGRRLFAPPHDLYEPLPDGTNDLTIGILNGHPATFEPIRLGKGAGGATITVAADAVLTIVYGTVDDNEWPLFDELVAVAESISY
jgi:hypothetical protein